MVSVVQLRKWWEEWEEERSCKNGVEDNLMIFRDEASTYIFLILDVCGNCQFLGKTTNWFAKLSKKNGYYSILRINQHLKQQQNWREQANSSTMLYVLSWWRIYIP